MDFWALTDDEIKQGLIISRRGGVLSLEDSKKPVAKFWFSTRLHTLGVWLEECGWDRDLMRLKYADEIAQLESQDRNPWFQPAGLNQGTLNLITFGVGVGKSMVVDIESE